MLNIDSKWRKTTNATLKFDHGINQPLDKASIEYTDTNGLTQNNSVSVDIVNFKRVGVVGLELIALEAGALKISASIELTTTNTLKIDLKKTTGSITTILATHTIDFFAPADINNYRNFRFDISNKTTFSNEKLYQIYYDDKLYIEFSDNSLSSDTVNQKISVIGQHDFPNSSIEIDNLSISSISTSGSIQSQIPQACSKQIINPPLPSIKLISIDQFDNYDDYITNKQANNNNSVVNIVFELSSQNMQTGIYRYCPFVGFQIQKLPFAESEWIDIDPDRSLLSNAFRNAHNNYGLYIPQTFTTKLYENEGLTKFRVRSIYGRDPTNVGELFSSLDINFIGENVDYSFSSWSELPDLSQSIQVKTFVPPTPTQTHTSTSTPTPTTTRTQTPTGTPVSTPDVTPTPSFTPTADPAQPGSIVLINDSSKLIAPGREKQKNGLLIVNRTDNTIEDWQYNNLKSFGGSFYNTILGNIGTRTDGVTLKSNNSSWILLEQYANNIGPDEIRFTINTSAAQGDEDFDLVLTVAPVPRATENIQEWVNNVTVGNIPNVFQTVLKIPNTRNTIWQDVGRQNDNSIEAWQRNGNYKFTIFTKNALLQDREYAFIFHGAPGKSETESSVYLNNIIGQGLIPLDTPRPTETPTQTVTKTTTQTQTQTPTPSQTVPEILTYKLYNNHEIGIKAGKLVGKGINSGGELGLGDLLNREVPEVFTMSGWRKILVNPYWSPSLSRNIPNVWYAIKKNYSLWEWREDPTNVIDDTIYDNSYTGVKFIDNDVRDQTFVNLTDLYYIGANNYKLYKYNILSQDSPTIVSDYIVKAIASISNKTNLTTGNANSEIALAAILYDGPTEFEIESITTEDINLIKLNENDFDRIVGNYYGSFLFRSKADKNLFAIGNNEYGKLGIGSSRTLVSFPELVVHPDFKGWSEISAGRYHCLAIDEDGRLHSWGRNNYYQLGLNTDSLDNVSLPTLCTQPVLLSQRWKKVFCGDTFSIAITTDGVCYGWGNNYYGNLTVQDTGFEQKTDRVPRVIYGNWDDIAIYKNSVLAIGLPPSPTPTSSVTATQTPTQTDTPNRTPTPTQTITKTSTTTSSSTPTVKLP